MQQMKETQARSPTRLVAQVGDDLRKDARRNWTGARPQDEMPAACRCNPNGMSGDEAQALLNIFLIFLADKQV
jgi:hypothetical protein